MKIKYLSIVILMIAAFLTGCSKLNEGTLRIDTLAADANEYYCNQKVKLWMCVESDNLAAADYEWGCDAGKITEGQGFFEACWLSPNTPGEYTVWCKVTIGKKSETRIRKMNVSYYFFDYFESSRIVWTGQSNTTRTFFRDDNEKGYWQFNLSGTTDATRYINYTFSTNDPDLKVPFSCRSTLGWIANMPADSITVAGNRAANTIGYQFSMGRAVGVEGLYIDLINFTWYPVGSNTNIMPIDPNGSGNKCNGTFTFRQTGVGASQTFRTWFYHPQLAFAQNEPKKVGFNISADYILTVYVAGTKVYETDALKTWRNDNNVTGDAYIREWRIPIPHGNNGNNAPTFYLTNTIADNVGKVYTGAANELPNP